MADIGLQETDDGLQASLATETPQLLQVKEVPLRDKILGQIESIISEADDSRRVVQSNQFIQRRTSELVASSEPTRLSLATEVAYKGFVHPDTLVRRKIGRDGVLINDPEIYRILFETFRQFKNDPAWGSRSIREIAPQVLLRTLGVYFGNDRAVEGLESRNREFYDDHTTSDSEDISISEFKGKGIAVCVEKASVAQNLLTFMGYNSKLIFSMECSLDSPEQDGNDGHVYLVVSSETSHVIYDPSNPVIVSKPDGSFHAVLPASYPISDEQYANLISGGQVEVKHTDLIWDGNSYRPEETTDRIYGGPKNAKIAP